MSVAEKLDRLVRIVPGISGYQDRENARETDKLVRMRLSNELGQLVRDLEVDKRRLLDAGDRSALALLDRLAGKLEKLGRMAEYAGRGYSGLFDLHKVDQKALERLYAFDLGLFETLVTVKARAMAVHQSRQDPQTLKRAGDELEAALDDFERAFDGRRQLIAVE